VDHQSGLANGVHDINSFEFKHSLLALAKIAALFRIPTIVSTSRQDGPNGPYLSEILKILPNDTVIVHRQGEINAWDNSEFKAAAQATGASQFIVSGIVTEVCAAFVALSLRAEGYDVYVAVDSSGTYSSLAAQSGVARMIQFGVQPMTWFAIACEFQRDWRNSETVEGFTAILKDHLPFYANLIEGWTFQSQAQQNNTQQPPAPVPAPVEIPVPVQPPVVQPPVVEPPVGQPPVVEPPVVQPPVGQPPVIQPPVSIPPVEQPPQQRK
jgi:nicotinamidase-related amidase